MFKIRRRGTLALDYIDIYDIDYLYINTVDKTIEANEKNGFMIAKIEYEKCKKCEYMTYNENGDYSGQIISIIKDGEFNNSLKRL